uniref:Polymer-forming cytoskeletal protein n=1 Tax=Pseudothermotoga hypogea TaxID=57487 RepID=A0A832MNV0_9THEM
MREGSVLVVSLVVVIFLALTVLLVLAIYAQVTNNYALQQKKLLVSNVAKSAAYTMAETVKKWFTDGRNDLVQNLASAPTSLSLPEFRGTIECSLIPISNGYEVKCKAILDKVEDSYSLALILRGGLTFRYAIDTVTMEVNNNNLKIVGDVLVRDGSLGTGNNSTVTGNVYLMNGSLSIGENSVVTGNVYLMNGSLNIDNNSTITGNVYLANGSLTMKNNSVVEEDVLAIGNVTGTGTIRRNAVVTGTIESGVTVLGDKTENASSTYVLDEISRRVNTSPPTSPPLPATPTFFPNPAVKLTDTVISESNRTYYTGSATENGLSIDDKTLTLRIPSDGELSFAVKKLNFGNNVTIEVEGNGVVMIYVEDDITAGNKLDIIPKPNTQSQFRLLIYSNKPGSFDFGNKLSVGKGGGFYIYAPEKSVKIGNSPNQSKVDVYGAIVAKEIKVQNNLYLALPELTSETQIPWFPTISFDSAETGQYGSYVEYRSWGQ